MPQPQSMREERTLLDSSLYWLVVAGVVATFGGVAIGVAAAESTSPIWGNWWFRAGIGLALLGVLCFWWAVILVLAHRHSGSHLSPNPSRYAKRRNLTALLDLATADRQNMGRLVRQGQGSVVLYVEDPAHPYFDIGFDYVNGSVHTVTAKGVKGRGFSIDDAVCDRPLEFRTIGGAATIRHGDGGGVSLQQQFSSALLAKLTPGVSRIRAFEVIVLFEAIDLVTKASFEFEATVSLDSVLQ